MRFVRQTICIALFYIVSFLAFSNEIQFDKLTLDDGLPLNTVRTIIQDNRGFLWFGTDAGLASFDGYNIKNYVPDNTNPNSLPDGFISDLIIDDDNSLWVATDKGVARYNLSTDDFSIYSKAKNDDLPLSSEVILSIAIGADNILWIATKKGLDRLNILDGHLSHFSLPKTQSMKTAKITNLFTSKDGQLIVGTSAGMSVFDEVSKTYQSIHFENDDTPYILSIAQESSGDIWVGVIGGLYKYEVKSNKAVKVKTEQQLEYVFSLLVDSEDNLWLGTDKFGLLRFRENGNIYQITSDFSRHSALSENTVMSLYQDHTNKIWIGSYNSGVNSFYPQTIKFGSYLGKKEPFDCLPIMDVRSALQISSSLILIGTIEGLIQIDAKEKKCLVLKSNKNNIKSISSNEVYSIFLDSSDEIWIGTSNGLDKFDLISQVFTRIGEQLDNIPVHGIIELSGNLVLRTPKGLYKINKESNNISEVQIINRLIKNSAIHAFDIDNNGNLWLATNNGIYGLNKELDSVISKKQQYQKSDDLVVRSLTIDTTGNIWITIENAGLFIFEPTSNSLNPIGKQIGLSLTNGFAGLHADKFDNVWLVSLSNGLFKINIKNKKLVRYRKTDGLHSNGFNFDSFTQFNNGDLLFGGKSGFNIFDPNQININETPALVSLTKLRRFGETVVPNRNYDGLLINKHISKVQTLNLSHKDTIFGFDFVATHYLAPNAIRYTYKLEGFDSEWTETNAQNRGVTFNNIDSGTYVFRLKAVTINNAWSEEIELKVVISPAPWRTWWAYTIYVIICFIIILFSIHKRTRILQERAITLQETVIKRTFELNQEKEKVENLLLLKNDEFINISHEFRTPLTLILGPISQLLKLNKAPSDRERLSVVQRNGYRLLRMVDQLLNLETFRIKTITQKSPQATGKIIHLLAESFSDLAEEKGVRLHITKIEDVNFEFTPDALEKIVVNLLSNAIKYTHDKGNIYISSIRNKSNELEIKVRDTGIGIEENKLSSIFERYQRILSNTSEQITGAGIGLSLVKSLVNAHGGRIEIESKLGEGTCLKLFLPIVKEVSSVEITPNANSDIVEMELISMSKQKGRAAPSLSTSNVSKVVNSALILVIEDNQDMLEYIQSSIAETFKVLLAKDGMEGVRMATENVPDLIISDVMMPFMDGYQVTRELRNNFITNHIPIILLTARSDRDSRIKGWNEKADEYLTKPFDAEELNIRIANLLGIRDIIRKRYIGTLTLDSQNINQHIEQKLISPFEKRQQEFLEKLSNAISKLYTDSELKMGEISFELAMSERQFFRKLVGVLDMTPTEYLNNYRLSKALDLLKQGEPVSNVALDVGFSSHTYFGKCFKAKYGMIPSEYNL